MRVLFLNTNQSPVYGGMERWMIDAAAGLAARGHVTALVGRPGAAWLAAGSRVGVRVRTEVRGTRVQRVLRIGAAMRAERPDVVIVKAKKAARMAALGRATGAGGRVVLDALAGRIVTLARDPARRDALGRAARRRIEAEFTQPRTLERCETILAATRVGTARPAASV